VYKLLSLIKTNMKNMIFISQTAANAEGDYTMTWKSQDGTIVITKHNLFV
jgi:hypothetical protein